jgi:alkaline phosphatase
MFRPRSIPTLLPMLALLLLGASLAPAEGDSGASAAGAPSARDAREASAAADPRADNPWFTSGREQIARARATAGGPRRAKNVILFVGDGMGVSTVTAARILEGQRRGQTGEENRLAFEELPFVAFSKTYSTDMQVPDSAATMTAIVSGVKTLSGVLGVDETIRRGDASSVADAAVPTLLEEAERHGLATGVVSTARVTHATPAACYAHTALRSWEDDAELPEAARAAGFADIARQLVELEAGDGVEVALGGGRRHFLPRDVRDPELPSESGHRLDGRDLTREWVERREGAAYVWNRDQLTALDRETTHHLLGLFEPGHMRFETDRASDPAGEPSLAEMTALAIELLERDPDGFFLMVEGGRIDHGHHAGNAYRALTETIAFSDAVRVAREMTGDDTLIVVTADHSHTLTISGYPSRGNPILGKVAAPNWRKGGEETLALDEKGRPYTTLSYANGPGHVGGWWPPDLEDVDTTAPDYRQAATVPLPSETHAGEDVPVYAGGAGAALFHGVQEQSYLYHAMVEALGWTRNGVPIDRDDHTEAAVRAGHAALRTPDGAR